MWKNRSPLTVVPESAIEIARQRIVDVEDEMERIADLAFQMGVEVPAEEMEELEYELQEAEDAYWLAVDSI